MSHKFNTLVFELNTRVIADPAVGTDFVITPNPLERIQIIGIKFDFTCDANAANRLVHLHIATGANHTVGTYSPGLQTANEALEYEFSNGMQAKDYSATVLKMTAPLSDELYLQQNDTFVSKIANIQVGDQIANIAYRCKVWLTA